MYDAQTVNPLTEPNSCTRIRFDLQVNKEEAFKLCGRKYSCEDYVKAAIVLAVNLSYVMK